jgi:hypothetical protein
MGTETIAELEGWAKAARARCGLDDDVPRMVELCRALTGREPCWAHIATEAALVDGQVLLRHGTPTPRARWLCGHELAEHLHDVVGYCEPDREERCDALGAMLTVPRDAFRRAVRAMGHKVYDLAHAFRTTQSLALLRLGEVTGRPVMLLSPSGPRARGDEFCWPSHATLARALRDGRAKVHPLTIRDEANRIGLMARREVL